MVMPARKTLYLSDAIDLELDWMRTAKRKPSTIRSAKQTYDRLLEFCGNVRVQAITGDLLLRFMKSRVERGEGYKTLNLRRNWLRNLFKRLNARGYLSVNPAMELPGYTGTPTRKTRIPAADFEHLLDSAPTEIERLAVAMGLYLFLRAGEVADLRVGDVDLDSGYVQVTRTKTNDLDEMPICEELDKELRRWLIHYQEEMGPLDPRWYLMPRKTRRIPVGTGEITADGKYHYELIRRGPLYEPYSRVTHPWHHVQRALEAAGYPIRDEEGHKVGEGGHTLRRSGARALYDQLRASGTHDDANRYVQTMLGHKSFATTEIYLGLDLDRAKRNKLLAGRPMFPKAANVIALSEHREAEGR